MCTFGIQSSDCFFFKFLKHIPMFSDISVVVLKLRHRFFSLLVDMISLSHVISKDLEVT